MRNDKIGWLEREVLTPTKMSALIESTKFSSSIYLYRILDNYEEISERSPRAWALGFSGRFGRGGYGGFLPERFPVSCFAVAHTVSTSVHCTLPGWNLNLIIPIEIDTPLPIEGLPHEISLPRGPILLLRKRFLSRFSACASAGFFSPSLNVLVSDCSSKSLDAAARDLS